VEVIDHAEPNQKKVYISCESAVCRASFKCGSTLGHQGKSYRTSHLQCRKDKCTMLKVHDSCQMINQRR